MSRLLAAIVYVALLVAPGHGGLRPASADAGNKVLSGTCSRLVMYHSKGCPHCARALRYLEKLRIRVPDLDIEIHEVNESQEATANFVELNRRFGVARPSVPAFFACEKLHIGFTSPSTSGAEIEAMLGLQATQSAHFGLDDAGAQTIKTENFGTFSVDALGLPLFTLVIGLIDGFNPCAMWVLLFLLSLLVNMRDRVRMLAIAGTFVAVSGLIYFAFMAAWLNVFLIIGFSRAMQIGLGVLALAIATVHAKDFMALHHGPNLSIPESAKPGIYQRFRRVVRAESLAASLGAVTVVAVLVNLVELLCTAGLPALYTQILTLQNLSRSGYYGYLALYNLAYIFDDGLMVGIAVFTLTHRKLQPRQGRWLKLLSAIAIGMLGALLIFAPDWLR